MALQQNSITEVTRRAIVDMLLLRSEPYHGRLDYMDFLRRVWPIDEMPSQDGRFKYATRDIATHMGFGDWDDSYLLLVRLNLSSGPDDDFLRFLSEVVHPLVIPVVSEAADLVDEINQLLKHDGLRLVETSRTSGRPLYGTKPIDYVREAPEPTPWEKVNRQVTSMRAQLLSATSGEDYQTVGHLGREVMISLAQAVIDPAEVVSEDGVQPSDTDAARLLDAYIREALPGSGNEALRGAVRKSVKATSAVLHDRKATSQDASLIAELVSSSVQLMHILTVGPR